MFAFSRYLFLAISFACFTPSCWAGETKDIKPFVETAFKDQIDGLKKGIYCKALSCEVEIQNVTAQSTAQKTFTLSTTGWLQGTIPGLKGSAKRTLSLTGSYVLNTCIVKDIKPLVDTTENNNGWGSSRIEQAFKGVTIPTDLIMSKEDCLKVDTYLSSL